LSKGLSAGTHALVRALGLGGLTTEEAMTKAARPYVKDSQGWSDSLKIGMPRIIKAAKEKGFKDLGEFIDVVHDAGRDLWTNTIQPQIDRHATDKLSGAPIAANIRSRITPAMVAMPSISGGDVEYLQALAKDFDNFNFNLKEANEFLTDQLNPQLRAFYRMSPVERNALRMTDGKIAGMEAAADALRDHIYGHLESVGEDTPAAFRKEYGAIKDISRSLEKRLPVDARQLPLNVTQTLGLMGGLGEMVGAFAVGSNPLTIAAGAVPIAVAAASKMRNR